MGTKTDKQQAVRLRTLLVDEYGPRWRDLDSILLLQGRQVAGRIDVGQFDTAILNFLGGQEGYHSLECYRLPTKKPASSGLGLADKVFAFSVVTFALIGAFVTVASVAGAMSSIP